MAFWRKWRYKNLTFLILSFVVAFFVFRTESIHTYLLKIGDFGYIGAFIAGILFVSTFTVATGAVLLLVLAERLSPIELVFVAGIGGVVGDFLIFHFVKDGLGAEVERLYDQVDDDHSLRKLSHTKYFSWLLPVIGAIIIASPFPDELGVSLMGIVNMKTYKFLVLSFFLDLVSVTLIVAASAFIKP